MHTSFKGFSNKELVYYAPSVGAQEAHPSRTDKYGFVSTLDNVDGLREAGFVPTGITQASARDKSKRNYTKHFIAFTREQDLPILQRRKVGDLFLQAYLTNSHAGNSSWVLDRGVYRLACDNGLMVGGGKDISIRLQHRGNVVEEVVKAMLHIAANAGQIMERIEEMRRVRLDRDERLAFGRAALALRWPDVVEAGEGSGAIPTPAQIVEPVRHADQSDDVWTVFNRAQEKLINGRVPVFNARGYIIKRTRAINGIDGLTDLNKGLWVLAEQFAKRSSHW